MWIICSSRNATVFGFGCWRGRTVFSSDIVLPRCVGECKWSPMVLEHFACDKRRLCARAACRRPLGHPHENVRDIMTWLGPACFSPLHTTVFPFCSPLTRIIPHLTDIRLTGRLCFEGTLTFPCLTYDNALFTVLPAAFSSVHTAALQEERPVTYTVDAAAYSFWIPAAAATPNVLFCSCNGMTGADCGAVEFARKSSSVRFPPCAKPLFCRWCVSMTVG